MTFGELTETPLGPISFYAGDRGLQRLSFSSLKKLKQNEKLSTEHPSFFGLETIGILLTELNEYLHGIRKTFSVKIDWKVLSGFQQEVLAFASGITFGQVRTYGEIASALGKPGGARAVGKALGENPVPIVIPCHRVIGADGVLRGYQGGIKAKAFLLNLEGHEFQNGKIII